MGIQWDIAVFDLLIGWLMFDPSDINTLTDFQRNTKAFIGRLRQSGRPEVLTVNGRPALIVQDAAAFERMIEEHYRAYLVEAGRVGIEQMEAGKTRPWKDAKRDIRARVAAAKLKRRSA